MRGNPPVQRRASRWSRPATEARRRVTRQPVEEAGRNPEQHQNREEDGQHRPAPMLRRLTPAARSTCPRIEATDRSISPADDDDVMGSAMIAISPEAQAEGLKMLDHGQELRRGRRAEHGDGDRPPPAGRFPSVLTAAAVAPAAAPLGSGAAAPGGSLGPAGGLWLAPRALRFHGESSLVAARPPAGANHPVDGDRHQQQETGDRLVPERRDAQGRLRADWIVLQQPARRSPPRSRSRCRRRSPRRRRPPRL